jgi:hypothetical protein
VLLNRKPIQTVGELTGRGSIGQSFVARHNHLHRIDVLVTTFCRRNTRDVIFHLRTSPTATSDLATVRVNASLIADNSYARFVFDPQPDSRGKSYYFCVESPESVPGDAITLWAYRDVSLSNAKLYWNGHTDNGQLAFGAFYVYERFGEAGERPLMHGWTRPTTPVGRAIKAYYLLSSQGIRGLWREVVNYWKWKTGRL